MYIATEEDEHMHASFPRTADSAEERRKAMKKSHRRYNMGEESDSSDSETETYRPKVCGVDAIDVTERKTLGGLAVRQTHDARSSQEEHLNQSKEKCDHKVEARSNPQDGTARHIPPHSGSASQRAPCTNFHSVEDLVKPVQTVIKQDYEQISSNDEDEEIHVADDSDTSASVSSPPHDVQLPSGGKAGHADLPDSSKARKVRTIYKAQQVYVLEQVFGRTHYPDPEVIEKLAKDLEISEAKIKVWFQNKRARWRRRAAETGQRGQTPTPASVALPPQAWPSHLGPSPHHIAIPRPLYPHLGQPSLIQGNPTSPLLPHPYYPFIDQTAAHFTSPFGPPLTFHMLPM